MQCLKKFCYIVQNKPQYYNSVNSIHRKRKYVVLNFVHRFKHDSNTKIEEIQENEEEKSIYEELCQDYLGTGISGHRVFILQPYIKWGIKKKRNTTPALQLSEAVALIDTLPNWSVVDKQLVPLLTLQKKQLIGKGSFETLQKQIRRCTNVTAIFISTNILQFRQIAELQSAFHLPIYDRYSIVINIFREHAKTPEAKLQVALAEIPYIRKKMIDLSSGQSGRINLDEKRNRLLESRERKLKNALEKLKEHRKMIKGQRHKYGFPTVAVVGYTNAGKTSLIKALTGDVLMEPKNKLFATLDTTVHQGFLPNKLKVLYVDTIGFIQDVPETLIEPFTITLEDAMNADIIIHVYDKSHPDAEAQVQHVQKIIQPMIGENKLVINVANKCDIVRKDIDKEEAIPEDTIPVSSVNLTGIDLLRLKIEKEILNAANLLSKRIRVPIGGLVESWLYKETTVINAEPDPEDSQYLLMDVVMTTSSFYRLKRLCKERNTNSGL